MPVADPVSVGFDLLYTTLSGDATLMAMLSGVYQVMAPTQSTPDYALLIHQSATDTNSGTATRLLSRLLYQVKIVGPVQDAANLRAAFARADALLQPSGQPLRNTAGALDCFREQAFSIGELVNGALWLNVGGLYRIEV
jgi:hypothetical protein